MLEALHANNKTRIIVGTVLEVEIGTKVNTSGRCRTCVVTKSDLGGGDMKVDTTNIRSVKLHTPENILPDTDGDGGERAAAATMTNTVDTTITDPVSIRVFEAPEQDPLNYEAFRVVVAQPMDETPVRPISKLTKTSGSVVGAVITHVMYAYTVEKSPPPPLPLFIPLPLFLPVPLSPLLLTPILAPLNPSPHRRSLGLRSTTRSHSTG